MLIYQEFLAINEELPAFDPSERLRWAVHEIMVRLKDGATMKFETMSEILEKDFKINISPEILKEIFDKWDKYNDPDYSVFKKEDKNWMDAWALQGYVRRKCRDKQSFGKHRYKATTSSAYSANSYTYSGGSYVNGKWVANKNDINRYGRDYDVYYGD
jgi:hypothetical protein